jgi:hypothetical protein
VLNIFIVPAETVRVSVSASLTVIVGLPYCAVTSFPSGERE